MRQACHSHPYPHYVQHRYNLRSSWGGGYQEVSLAEALDSCQRKSFKPGALGSCL